MPKFLRVTTTSGAVAIVAVDDIASIRTLPPRSDIDGPWSIVVTRTDRPIYARGNADDVAAPLTSDTVPTMVDGVAFHAKAD